MDKPIWLTNEYIDILLELLHEAEDCEKGAVYLCHHANFRECLIAAGISIQGDFRLTKHDEAECDLGFITYKEHSNERRIGWLTSLKDCDTIEDASSLACFATNE